MTRRCTIEGCLSRSDKPEHRGVTFHSFPFDSKTRDVWISNCKIAADKNITKSVAVCSRHFRRADFVAVKGGKYTLKTGSVPTIFPWGKIEYTRPNENEFKDSESPKPMNVDANTKELFTSPESQSIKSEPLLGSPKGNKRKSIEELSIKENIKKIKPEIETKSPTSQIIKPVIKKESLNFVPGAVVEAQDFDGVWHKAKVDEVDNVEREVLLKFQESEGKNYNKGATEEWIPMNSSRLRPFIDKNIKPEQSYLIGEKVMARWTGARKFPATISKVFDNGTYEVLFDDGFIKIVKSAHISKVKQNKQAAATAVAPLSEGKSSNLKPIINQNESVNKLSPGTSKSSKASKKVWPLISKESLNLDELKLPHIPEDGEWCCHWVNDQPIGKEGFLMVGDHKKPTVIVDDWRLPAGWIKHMYQRSNVLGKWDVILVSPQGKRFRSKADLKQFIEEQGQIYNPDIYDFSIHRRRAKDINAYVYTKDYKPPPVIPKEAAYANVKPIEGGLPSSLINTTLNSSVLSALNKTESDSPNISMNQSVSESLSNSLVQLEDGWVYVGGLKVQIIENLFRCPDQSCNKNFRKENHLQIHVKHYHHDLAKLLGECPNMQELALKRTIGEPSEESIPRNHLPNAQFFAKVHQQEIQAKTQRSHKTSATSTPTVMSPILSSPKISESSIYGQTASTSELFPDTLSVSPVEMINEITSHPTGDVKIEEIDEKIISLTEKKLPLTIPTIKSISHTKKKVGRKSNRQRTTRKFLSTNLKTSALILDTSTNSVTTPNTNLSPRINDFEETRHSFNATPEMSKLTNSKKIKNLQNLITTESIDGNSHTTGSFPEISNQSPQYVRENGELIKIVKMRQEEIINCLCSYPEEDGLMIQCELCLCWQHGICNGIEQEKQVPEKYVCYICKNPQRGRESMKYIHDQDWLYEGKLPVANYHAGNPKEKEVFDILKKSHTLTGNLLETRKFLHSLKVKINIAGNKDHPKMYLWAKKWENDIIKEENKYNSQDEKLEETNQPSIPQPEAPIDPAECQHRLLDHIKTQQQKVKERLESIEQQITEIEMADASPDIEDSKIREILALMIKDLSVMKKISKINTVPKTYSY